MSNEITGTRAGSFSFAELASKVNGKYNRGEIKLDAKGGLSTVNGHVWIQVRNNTVTTAEENMNVRLAVYQSIAHQFGKDASVGNYLKVAQEFLIGNDSIGKPLGRDEVRAIIAQLDVQRKEGVRRDNSAELEHAAQKSLSTEDFKLLLETIRAVKEGLPNVSRSADGSFKLDGAARGFSGEQVLSGLRSGMGRGSILQTRTVNTGRHEALDDLVTRGVVSSRKLIHAEFELATRDVLKGFHDKLTEAFKGLKGRHALQAEKTGRVILRMLRDLNTDAVPGLRAVLDEDLEELSLEMTYFNRQHKDDSAALKDLYKHVLALADQVLGRFRENVSLEILQARDVIRETIMAESSNLVEGTDPVETNSQAERTELANNLVSKALNGNEKLDLEKAQDFNEVKAEAAKVVVDVFEQMVADLEVRSIAEPIIEEVRNGTRSFDDFLPTFTERLKEKYSDFGELPADCAETLTALNESMFQFDKLKITTTSFDIPL